MNAHWEMYRVWTGWKDVSELHMQGAVLTLKSLGVDTLTWTQIRGASEFPVPFPGEGIALRRDGVIVFQGVISRQKYVYEPGRKDKYALTASGGLYAASISQITDIAVDGTGASASRPSFQFPPGNLAGMVSRLLTAMPGINAGALSGIDANTVAGTFLVGRKTYTGGTYLSVLLDLLKPLPDVVGSVGYGIFGDPRLNITRRPAMPTITIQLGVDDVAMVEMAPRYENVVTGVTLTTASRNAAGKTIFGFQTAGDGARLVSFSGPEIGAFVPPDNLPSVAIRTTPVTGAWSEIKVLDADIAKAIAQYGDFTPGGARVLYSTTYNYPTFNDFSTQYSALPSGVTIKNEAGVAATGNRFISGQMIDFLKTDYGAVETTLTVTGNIVGQWLGGRSAAPLLFQSLMSKIGVTRTGYDSPSGGTLVTQYSLSFSYQVQVINLSYPTLTTLYAKAAYEYLQPPANMAENMRRAGDFAPYEGQVMLNPKFPWANWIDNKLNVLNGGPELATAGALIESASVALQSGVVTLGLGNPARTSLNSVLARFSGASTKDNIVEL